MGRIRSCTYVALVSIALTLLASPAAAGPFDVLGMSLKDGKPLSYAGDTYYSNRPWIWVSSSDGVTYDGFDADQLVFRVYASFDITVPPLVTELPIQKIRFSGGGFAKQEFDLVPGSETYITNYLPPATEYTPIEMCNMEAAKRGADAMKKGFVLKADDAYEVTGWVTYRNEWSKTQTVKATEHSEVYLICAGQGKPLGGGEPAPPKPPPGRADDLSPGFLVTAAELTIPSQYDGMKTDDCPVEVPVKMTFEGTQGESLQYRLTSAHGGASRAGVVQLEPNPGGKFRATREIKVPVPGPKPSAKDLQATRDLAPGKGGGPSSTPGATDMKAAAPGGPPGAGPAVIQQESDPGVHADSFRIEVLSPNKIVSAYEGYRVICEGDSKGPEALARVTEPDEDHRLAIAPGALPTGVPQLTLGSAKKKPGENLVIQDSTPGLITSTGRKQDDCRLPGLRVEWPVEDGSAGAGRGVAEKPTLRLRGKTLRPKSVIPGAVTVLVLPTVDLPEGRSKLEARGSETKASWNLQVQADCSQTTEVQRRPAPAQAPGRGGMGTRESEGRQRRSE